MTEKVYPYRTRAGKRSILEAVDRKDAREHLKDCYGTKTRFCEIDCPGGAWMTWYWEDGFNCRVDAFLSENRNFVT